MKGKPLLLPRWILIFIGFLGLFSFLLWLWFRVSLYIMPKFYYDLLGVLVIFSLGVVWIITFIDILRNSFESKIKWLIIVCTLGALGSIVYLVKRYDILQKE